MRKTCKLKVRPYTDLMIDINEYLAAFTGGKASDNIGETELKEIILSSIPNGWSKNRMCSVLIVKPLFLNVC